MRFTSLTSLPFMLFGHTSVTILVNQIQGVATQAISPALTDPVLSNYLILATCDDPVANAGVATCSLLSASLLRLRINRPPNSAVTNTTLITVNANPLLDVSGMAVAGTPLTVTDPHGSSLTLFDHSHEAVGHPITDPGHTHQVLESAAAVTVKVDWMIIHT